MTYSKMLQNCARFGTNVAVINVRDDAWERFESTPPEQRSIALWWSDDQVGQLITLIGWLCRRHPDWSRASIIVNVPSEGDPEERAAAVERVSQVLEAGRIDATVRVVEPNPAALTAAMAEATLAFAPLRIRRGMAMGPFQTPLGMLIESLPLAVMVLATEQVELDAEAEDQDLAEFTRMLEQVDAAKERAADLDAHAARLLVAAEALRLEAQTLGDGDPAEHAALRARLTDTEAEATAAYRTYLDAKARCTALEAELAELSPDGAAVDFDPVIWQRSADSET